MKPLVSALVAILCVCLVTLISIATMIWGWGLEPKSWGVIIGGAFLTFFVSFVQAAVNDALK